MGFAASRLNPSYDASIDRQFAGRATGATAPVFPPAVDAEGGGALDHRVDFAGGEEFHVVHGHSLHLQVGVEFEIDRNPHRLAQRSEEHTSELQSRFGISYAA